MSEGLIGCDSSAPWTNTSQWSELSKASFNKVLKANASHLLIHTHTKIFRKQIGTSVTFYDYTQLACLCGAHKVWIWAADKGPKWVCPQFPWWPHPCLPIWVSRWFWLGFRWGPTWSVAQDTCGPHIFSHMVTKKDQTRPYMGPNWAIYLRPF